MTFYDLRSNDFPIGEQEGSDNWAGTETKSLCKNTKLLDNKRRNHMKLKSISCMEWEFLAELIRKLPKYSWGNQKQLRGNSLNVQTQFIPKRKLPIFSLAALVIVVQSIYSKWNVIIPIIIPHYSVIRAPTGGSYHVCASATCGFLCGNLQLFAPH